MNELALFAGAGGGILGGKLLGWRTVCAVERDAYAAQVLAQRQNDGVFEPFPIWSDVSSFDGYPWRGIVDVISGGFPCQDISSAGSGCGLDGARSGLWSEMARIIGEVRPPRVLVENSPLLTSRGGDRVIGDLTALGYDCKWGVIGAHNADAPHKRDRIWIVATRQCAEHPIHKAIRKSIRRNRIKRGSIPEFFYTPKANDAEKRGNVSADKRNGIVGQVMNFYPTPTASDGFKWNNMTVQERVEKGQHIRLCNFITSMEGNRVGGLLNPNWEEWLMGWPIGHTALKPLETDKLAEWYRWHGVS